MRQLDAKAIFQEAAPDAAAFLASVVRGDIDASVGERITASKLVLDRSIGTPIGMDVAETRNAALEMLDRVKELESRRASLRPVTAV
jgi:hypothetical protein